MEQQTTAAEFRMSGARDLPLAGATVLDLGGDSTQRPIIPSRGIGADNRSVYQDLLGLGEADVDALAAAGAI